MGGGNGGFSSVRERFDHSSNSHQQQQPMDSVIGSPNQGGKKNKWNNPLTSQNGLPASRKG